MSPPAVHLIALATLLHQQYLSDAKNPHGYCGIGGTGVSCPAGLTSTETG
jgi:peptide methionine sulfoxide reductase MsrA